MSFTSTATFFKETGDPFKVLKTASVELPKPGPKQVVLKTLVATLNPSDVVTVEGTYPSVPPATKLYTGDDVHVIGNEGSFKVVAVGSDVTKVKVGDVVLPTGIGIGSWRTHVLADESQVAPVPADLPLTPQQLATAFINPATAYLLLKDFVTLEKGDWVIQNVGNSNVGRAVSQFSKLWGINTISVVRNRKNIEELRKELIELGSAGVITEEELEAGPEERKAAIKRITGQDESPIKLGLEAVGGPAGNALAEALAPNGTLVVYGSMSQKPLSLGAQHFIYKNLTVKGFWLSLILKQKPQVKGPLLQEIFPLIARGVFKSPPLQEHVVKPDVSADEFLKIVHGAFKVQLDGFSNKKQVLVFE